MFLSKTSQKLELIIAKLYCSIYIYQKFIFVMKQLHLIIWLMLLFAQKSNSQVTIIKAVLQPPCASLKIEKPNLEKLEIFPNPSRGILFIKDFNSVKNTFIKIYDVKGSLVFKKQNLLKEATLNLRKLKNGFYFLIYENEEKKITKKLIIQK